MREESLVREILAEAGVSINGSMPWDLQVKDPRFFNRILSEGSLGLGEAYMDGWWDCERLDEFFSRIMPLEPQKKIRNITKLILQVLCSSIMNRGRKSNAFTIGERHYDIGNEFYAKMLDRRMVYSCGYWKNAQDLDQAQERKLDLICRKLGLKGGDRVLDIGCGWGSFAKFAAENYAVSVVGITVSRQQVELGTKVCQGLPVEIRLQDYRDINEKFDHIVSIGMFEHVGPKNYRTYMEIARKYLSDNGLFLLHTIGESYSKKAAEPWTDKYIFPNSLIPSMKQISAAAENLFIIEDVHNFGSYYDPTLMSWFNNFDQNWDSLKHVYGDRFYRIWKYYLLSSAGTFRARCLQVWQIVLSKNGVPGNYVPVR